jgi:hypothetical protein
LGLAFQLRHLHIVCSSRTIRNWLQHLDTSAAVQVVSQLSQSLEQTDCMSSLYLISETNPILKETHGFTGRLYCREDFVDRRFCHWQVLPLGRFCHLADFGAWQPCPRHAFSFPSLTESGQSTRTRSGEHPAAQLRDVRSGSSKMGLEHMC